jgi:methylase of polypeptide subunit release factors
MDYYLTLDHWSSIVRQLKDDEREHDILAQATSDLAKDILLVIRSTRFKQGVLFKQKRGEEYEKFVEKLNDTYDHGAVKRILSNDEFWEVSFSLR